MGIKMQKIKSKLHGNIVHKVKGLSSAGCIPTTRDVSLYLIADLFSVMPLHAGKVFDFDATLPAMAAQFLLLTLFLEKTWFGPVGKVLDERNDKILTRVKSLSEVTGELDSLQNEAETLLKEARAEAKAKIAEAKVNSAAKAESE